MSTATPALTKKKRRPPNNRSSTGGTNSNCLSPTLPRGINPLSAVRLLIPHPIRQSVENPVSTREADLSVQTGAGEHIGDLPLVAKVARESTAKINCPTSRWRIENRFQTQSAFLQPLMPAPQPWRIALLRSLRYALSSSG